MSIIFGNRDSCSYRTGRQAVLAINGRTRDHLTPLLRKNLAGCPGVEPAGPRRNIRSPITVTVEFLAIVYHGGHFECTLKPVPCRHRYWPYCSRGGSFCERYAPNVNHGFVTTKDGTLYSDDNDRCRGFRPSTEFVRYNTTEYPGRLLGL